MTWNNRVLKVTTLYKKKEEVCYYVCENHTGAIEAHTGPISPMGETLLDLRRELKRMLRAVEETISGKVQCIEDEEF